MLASEILRRIIPTLTETKIRPFPGAAAVVVAGTVDAAIFALLAAQQGPSYLSADIDFAAPSTGNVVVPALPGFYFQPSRLVPINKTTSGSCTTGPTIKIGNSAGVDNVCVGAANLPIAAIHAAGPLTTATMAINANGPLIDLATPITASVTVAAAGTSLVWVGKILVLGTLVRASDF
jgi:hypothetical protein